MSSIVGLDGKPIIETDVEILSPNGNDAPLRSKEVDKLVRALNRRNMPYLLITIKEGKIIVTNTIKVNSKGDSKKDTKEFLKEIIERNL